MMGPDIERILSFINNVKEICEKQIGILESVITLPIEVNPVTHIENPDLGTASSPFAEPIITAVESSRDDLIKMQSLNDGMYIGATSFNNSYGSPWKELANLDKSVEKLRVFVSANPILTYHGHKVMMAHYIHNIHSDAVDAKWALTYFHDYTQRGFDDVFNGKSPSFTWSLPSGEQGIGNVKQGITENVGIPAPDPSPF